MAAGDSLRLGHYEWSSFQAQQAAEKAAKALLRFYNHEARGHSVLHLLTKAREWEEVHQEVLAAARELDKHYVQSRYPNDFPEGFPAEFYDEDTARRSLEHADKVISFVKSVIK